MENNVIIGLDISISCTGIVIMEGTKLIYYEPFYYKECKETNKEIKNFVKLHLLQRKIKKLYEQYRPKIIVIEKPLLHFYGGKSSASTLFKLFWFNTSIQEFCFRNDYDFLTVATRSARKKVYGSGNMDKEYILNWNEKEYPEIINIKNKSKRKDVSDAIALALYGTKELENEKNR